MSRVLRRRIAPADQYANAVKVLKRKMVFDAQRAAETRKLVSFGFLRGDLHMHTTWSDGWGSVAEMVETAEARGLDFIFVTDHNTVRQKAECRKYKNVWWGQEPGAGPHHICILDNARRFRPSKDMKRDAERLRAMGVFFFYPHPTGWFPGTYYTEAQMDALAEAGPEFAMEVMNGIFRVDAFHDAWTEGSAALWDFYLMQGYQVTGLGTTDAHFPLGVGNVWTGLIGARLSKRSVLNVLRSGKVYASSGPAINLTCGKTPMGGTARARSGKAAIVMECADAYGLNWASIIQDGREVKRFSLQGAQHLRERVALSVAPGGYVRAECAAMDDRRAYANPIYFA